MASPFDFAWCLLKARPQNPYQDFSEETSLADEMNPDIHEEAPFRGQGTADDAAPEEAESAMAPEAKAEQVLAGLSPEEKEALHRLLMGGGGDE